MFASSGDRMPPCGVPVTVSLLFAEFREDSGFEEGFDQRQDTLVLDPVPHSVHQGRVVDRVEARLDVRIQHPAISPGAEIVDLGDRVLSPPSGGRKP